MTFVSLQTESTDVEIARMEWRQKTRDAYHRNLAQPSDIQHHLPLLYSLARGNVVELGTRAGVSTSALLAGVGARGGQVVSVDIDPNCARVAEGHPQWVFICADSRDEGLPRQVPTPIDLLLIDSEHRVEVTAAELALWAPYMALGGYILLHDPETFPGVRRAVMDFCAAQNWPVTFVLPCNGMAVIEVPRAAVKGRSEDTTTQAQCSCTGQGGISSHDPRCPAHPDHRKVSS